MTEKTLKHVLHDHAETPSFDPVDLATIRRDGNRTLRRRRVGLSVGGVVAAGAVVAATALAVLPGFDSAADRTSVATDPAVAVGSTASVSWVEGSTLHRTGSPDIDLGRPAVAYVRTSHGYVFSDAAGTVYSVEDNGTVEVGRTDPDAVKLVADPDRPVAAWLDVDGRAIVTYDQSTGADLTLLDRVRGRDPELTALDGSTVYVLSDAGIDAVDLETGEVERLDTAGRRVLDAFDGLLALPDDRTRPAVVFVRDQTTRLRADVDSSTGAFSPDGAWYSADADAPEVVSTRTGTPVVFDAPEFFATGYEWLDDTTVVMIAQEGEQAPIELLSCQVPAGTCVSAANLGSAEEMGEEGFQLPLGERL